MSKCKGCGITLQYENKDLVGYSPKRDSKLCQRCFKIVNYNEHTKASKLLNNEEIIAAINKKKCAVMFLCDLLNLNQKTIDMYNLIAGKKVLVITKCDIIPKNIKLDHLKDNIINAYHINDVIFVSTLSGYGKRNIIDYILNHKNILFAGPTSSGKSSLINYLFGTSLTVSNHKNTTQEFISIKWEDATIYDAPGFNEDYLQDLSNQCGYINPKTMLLKKGYMLNINDASIASDKDINITLFIPKDVTVKTKKIEENNLQKINVSKNTDLIISNYGFIYFKEDASLHVSANYYIDTRESIVGSK